MVCPFGTSRLRETPGEKNVHVSHSKLVSHAFYRLIRGWNVSSTFTLQVKYLMADMDPMEDGDFFPPLFLLFVIVFFFKMKRLLD